MKWTNGNYAILGKKVMLFEVWKFKAGSRERGNCLDRIAESLTLIKEPLFNVSQKSIRDRLRLLEGDFEKKYRLEEGASGISPEKTEIRDMEDYLEKKRITRKEI